MSMTFSCSLKKQRASRCRYSLLADQKSANLCLMSVLTLSPPSQGQSCGSPDQPTRSAQRRIHSSENRWSWKCLLGGKTQCWEQFYLHFCDQPRDIHLSFPSSSSSFSFSSPSSIAQAFYWGHPDKTVSLHWSPDRSRLQHTCWHLEHCLHGEENTCSTLNIYALAFDLINIYSSCLP